MSLDQALKPYIDLLKILGYLGSLTTVFYFAVVAWTTVDMTARAAKMMSQENHTAILEEARHRREADDKLREIQIQYQQEIINRLSNIEGRLSRQ